MSDVDDKLSGLMDHLGKEFKSSVKLVAAGFERFPCVSSGLPSLDAALNGGLPHGCMAEVLSPDGVGKTNLALTFCGNQAVKQNKIVFVIDAEQKLDPVLAKNLGVDLSKYPLAQPETLEEAFKIMDKAADKMGAGDMFMLDSVSALIPEAEAEEGIGHQSRGGNAKALADSILKIRSKIAQQGVVILFVNQVRDLMGAYVPTLISTGGRSLKHACAVRMELRRGQLIKDGEKVIGQEVVVKVLKSNHCAPYTETPLKLLFGVGFSKEHSLFDLAITQNVIQRTGAWYIVGDKKFQGENAVVEYLKTEEGWKSIFEKVKI